MGRPAHDLDDYLEWQQRLESQKESGLSIEVFCLREGVSRSTFHRWARQLRDGMAGRAASAGEPAQLPAKPASKKP